MKNLFPILLLLVLVLVAFVHGRLAVRRRRAKAEHNRALRRRSFYRWKRYGNWLGRPRSHRHKFQ